ncbi:heavy metal translocating P-type ATPase [Caldivirga maquilingensis]|uniref:Heavy metal translocating P-type ATPase n=1 Tax=Caldivirga maquilingensis (strain ATCC 700844 / DSM 13496 / JCM 10307 / IC-167) TaxID=397948 RepID=A8ME72_CALMQ|nr:heavy metal translocating P-type ATPase [Caldivirga maquilingensis]ABW02078.1 heavy metal translocating P-type ATPase [Caldivirga maquilingensis IC-167]
MNEASRINVKLSFREGVRRTAFKIVGMHCATCSLTVQKALLSVPGVLAADVSLANDEAVVVLDPGRVKYIDLLKAVEKAGYDIYREEATVGIRGLSPGDEALILNALNIPGVFEARVNLAYGEVKVTYNPLELNESNIVKAIEDLGLKVTYVKTGASGFDVDKRASEADLRDLRNRLLVSAPLTAVIMIIVWVLEPKGVIPSQSALWVGLALATIVEFYPGWRFIRGAVRAFRNGTANMDTLVALGTLTAYTYSLLYALHLVGGEAFLDSGPAVITLILLGRWLEARVRLRAASTVRSLAQLIPGKARVLVDGREIETNVKDIKPGDTIIIRPGELIPVDGIVNEGNGHVDESSMTGESEPRLKRIGDVALAGTRLLDGYLVIRATRVGEFSLMAQVIKLAREAQAARLPIQSIVDKISAYFTWVVIAVAALTLITWLSLGAPLYLAVLHMASVLVVACPCALGLATPMSIVVGVNKAAQDGILIKRGEAFERLNGVKVMAFDKTGTLTEGAPRVIKTIIDKESLILAASAEYPSNHPLAKAIVNYAESMGVKPITVSEFNQLEGMGVIAVVNGRSVGVGNMKLVKGMEAYLSPEFRKLSEGIESEGYTPLFVVIDGVVKGVLAVGDPLRVNAYETVNEVKRLGLRTIMLTGDAEGPAHAVAEKLGIDDVYADLMPDDKARVIREVKTKYGSVAMVGDGINDAVALNEADVGIAMGTGSDVAKEAGDVVLVSGNLKAIPRLIRLSRTVVSNIKFNIFYAFAYNIILIPVAAGVIPGLTLRPELAGLAMALSSLTVTLNAYSIKLRT